MNNTDIFGFRSRGKYFSKRILATKILQLSLLGFLTLLVVTAAFAQQQTEVREDIPAGVDVDDQFGYSVAMDDDTLVVGARFDEALGATIGAAYVIDANTGDTIRRLEPPSIAPGIGSGDDRFGQSLALSSRIIVVGAPNRSDPGIESGTTFVFNRETGNLMTELFPFGVIYPDDTDFNFAGFSVDVSERFIMVGAPGDVEGANGGSGAAYLYSYSTTNAPLLIGKIFASDPGFADNFGRRVAVSNSAAVAASPFDNDNGTSSGSVYVFNPRTGQQRFKITPADGAAGDLFGLALAIEGDTIAVGAPFADANGADSGVVYLFDAATGKQLARITPTDAAMNDNFGVSVDIDDNKLIVGANRENGPESAYVFDISMSQQTAQLTPSDGEDGFGFSVSLSGSRAAVGVPTDNDAGSLAGSVYIFELGGIDNTPIYIGTPALPLPTPVAP